MISDTQIVEAVDRLRASDGAVTYARLADRLGCSPANAHKRVRRLIATHVLSAGPTGALRVEAVREVHLVVSIRRETGEVLAVRVGD